MKRFIVEYTEDFGKTHLKVEVTAISYTNAFVKVSLGLSKDGAITNIVEVNT